MYQLTPETSVTWMPNSIQIQTAEHDAEDNRQAFIHSQVHIAAIEARLVMLRMAMTKFGTPQLRIEIGRLEKKLQEARRGR